jgi:CheY-like chemotaxis protein
VRMSRGASDVRIEVKDSGSGIDPELLPFVFDRFRQGDSQSSSRRGLGLGLAIARHLVDLHGGTVTATSAGAGTGSTFTVILPTPARDPETAARRRRRISQPTRFGAEPARKCLRDVRVLVVDDEADTRQVLRVMLEQAGAVVETASSAAEARAIFRRTPPDALLCDIGLGAENGYALMREIRALPLHQGGAVPAIALTGYAKSEDRERAFGAGFELHLAKPGPADLANIIASLLDRGEPV